MANGATWGLYARVSDPKQAEEGLSIEGQLAQLHAWAEQKHYATREFVDRGRSAWTENLSKRPAFQDMLDVVRAHELEGIAVTHLDRFSRKLLITLLVLGELGKLNVGFVSLENSAFDFTRPADRLLLSVLGAFAEYYSAELSRKIKRGLATRASKGLHNGLIPFGYCNGKCVDCKHNNPKCQRWDTLAKDTVILHPDDEPGVLLAFETYRQKNQSFDDIADVLNGAGYRSRTPDGRVLWNKHSIAEMLRNITYTGIVIHKGKEIPGQFPAIISRELFDEVAGIRQSRKSRQATFNHKYRIYLFGGIIRCESCGRVMRSTTRGSNKRLCYHCTSRELRHVECKAQNTWVYEDKITDQFAQIIAQFKLPEDWQARISELVNSNGKPHNHQNDKNTLIERLTRLKKQFEWDDISEDEYLLKRNEIKRALAEYDPPVERAFVDAARYLQNMATVWEVATQEERRDMVRAIFEEVLCDPDERRLVSLRPKTVFRFLFRHIPGLIEHDGAFDIQYGEG